MICNAPSNNNTKDVFFLLTVINYCDSSPCENGGSCESIVNGYICQCQPAYTGDNCQDGKHDFHIKSLFIARRHRVMSWRVYNTSVTLPQFLSIVTVFKWSYFISS